MATMATERFTRIAYTLQKPRNPADRPFKLKLYISSESGPLIKALTISKSNLYSKTQFLFTQ